jgi:hypothetical protein
MTIGSDYPAPVTVNGFLCKNCTDVGYAKKHIDPAHPKSGPYGINAKDDPTVKNDPSAAVTFGGNLASIIAKQTATENQVATEPWSSAAATETISGDTIGTQLDISA